jgi:putative selenium metabolism protein SsnA
VNKILTNACFINPYGEPEFISHGYLIIDGDLIAEVGSGDPPVGEGSERLDLRGQIVLPGMINAHTHLYSSLALGMPFPKDSPRNFVQILEQVWWKLDRALDPDMLQASFTTGLLGHLRHGVTTVIDHHSSPGCGSGSLDHLARVAQELGINISAALEISDRNGESVFQESLEENLRFHRAYQKDNRVRPLIGLHASFTLSDDSLQRIRDLLFTLESWGIHIHAAEDQADQEDARKRGYDSVLQRLDTFGLLNENSVIAHGVHFLPGDIEIAEKRGVMLVHNPTSNANNRVGMTQTDVLRRLHAGLGTDGMQGDVLAEARQGTLIRSSHLPGGEQNLDYLELLFRHNPEIATRLFGRKIGRLEPGYQADLVLYEYDPRTSLNAENWRSHVLFGLPQPRAVLSAGEFRLKDGRFVGMDIEDAHRFAREQAKRLWKRMENL